MRSSRRALWRGSPGVFEGSYFTSSEGGQRTPCLVRWPGHVPVGISSNEMVHQVGMFPTLLRWAECEVPQDRVIDGIDQRSFFLGRQEKSDCEGCLVWVGERLHGVKWRNFKVLFVKQRYLFDPALPLGNPHVINLITDTKEREPMNALYSHTWVMGPVGQLLKQLQESVKREPLIPAGVPLDYVPGRKK